MSYDTEYIETLKWLVDYLFSRRRKLLNRKFSISSIK